MRLEGLTPPHTTWNGGNKLQHPHGIKYNKLHFLTLKDSFPLYESISLVFDFFHLDQTHYNITSVSYSEKRPSPQLSLLNITFGPHKCLTHM